MYFKILDRLFDCIGFYAGSAIFLPYTSGMIKEEMYERYFCVFAENLSYVFNFYKEKIFSIIIYIGKMSVKGKENINKFSVTRE